MLPTFLISVVLKDIKLSDQNSLKLLLKNKILAHQIMVADKCFLSLIYVWREVIHHLLLLLIIFLILVYTVVLNSSIICYHQGQVTSYFLIFFYFQEMKLSCLVTVVVTCNQASA